MLDIAISATFAIVTIVMAYLGVHVTLHPTDSPRARFWYKAGFIVAAVVAVGLVVWQGKRTADANASRDALLKELETRAGQIEQQTKQPPSINVTVPPPVIPPPVIQVTPGDSAKDAELSRLRRMVAEKTALDMLLAQMKDLRTRGVLNYQGFEQVCHFSDVPQQYQQEAMQWMSETATMLKVAGRPDFMKNCPTRRPAACAKRQPPVVDESFFGIYSRYSCSYNTLGDAIDKLEEVANGIRR